MPNNSGRPDYHAYIQSPQWRQKANDAKRRAGYRCQVCNKSSSEIVLDAHHRTYERLGNERPEDITVLCRSCHQLFESDKKQGKVASVSSSTRAYKSKSSNNGGAAWFWVVAAIGAIGFFLWNAANNSAQPVDVAHKVTATAAATVTPIPPNGPYANRDSNMRAGPSTSYRIMGIAKRNQILNVVACNPACDWYQLADGKWIAANLVTGAPESLPVVGPKLTTSGSKESSATPNTIATIRHRATSVGAPTPQATLAKKQSATNRDSNLRAGPGTEYNIVGLARKGQAVTVVGCAKSCSWYMLSDSTWIAAYLVDNVTGSYATVSAPPLPKAPPLPTTPLVAPAPQATATPAPQATATPVPTVAPQACVIKGNISYNTGEKIYHVPGQAYYDDTVINEAYGERWFCSEEDARAAGWRKAKQ